MRILTGLTIALFLSCSGPREEQKEQAKINPNFPELAKAMNIYEVNIRQYTPEGTINAFKTHLPRLQKMGVDILWIMPVQPIGELSRKGPLGSYYSIKDYTAINKDFGSIDDFKSLVKEAHDKEMLVILDWVANHTSFDHEWTKIDGYHSKDSAGNVTWPKDTDWTDVADLNYESEEMRADMIKEMSWWVTEMDIDGFRCDVAGMVPLDFWKSVKDSMDNIKDLFMLAEWDEPEMHEAFHMTYGWGPHHWMNEHSKGHFNTDSLEALIQGDILRYGDAPFRMMFTTNHDENSWNGTVFERFGEGQLAYTAWAFMVRGMPLLYSGQEAGLSKRLRFFDKDTIDFSNLKYEDFYTKLLELKHQNEALFNGEFGGKLDILNDNNSSVSSFRRTRGANEVTVIVNLSPQKQSITISDEKDILKDEFTGENWNLKEPIEMNPYQVIIGIKN